MIKKMETKTQEKSGLTRRKTSQIVKFCAKDERNASLKKVSTILQKAENERTLEEQQVLSEYSEIVADLKLRWHRRDEAKRRVEEVEEPVDVLDEKCRVLAQALAQSEHLVVYTGAGISTAARIPDYRGSNGIWTRLREGKDIGNHDLSLAEPTFTHMSLSSLFHKKKLKYVVSQNCDGLHLRSGLPRCALSELHGNMYIEVCKKCQPVREYWRLFDVTENTARFSHKTMRRCYICNNDLIDTIVHFGERGTLQWPLNWSGACKNADEADTILCLGSSLKVLKRYPWLWQMNKPAKKRPNLYIVNLQWTPKDDCAVMKINGKCDDVMTRVMKLLGVDVPGYTREKDPIFAHASLLCELEMHTTNQPSLKLLECEEKVEIGGKTGENLGKVEENLIKIDENLIETEKSEVISGQCEVKSEQSEVRTETEVKSEAKTEKHEIGIEKNEVKIEENKIGIVRNEVGIENNEVGVEKNEVKTEQSEIKSENVAGIENNLTRVGKTEVIIEQNEVIEHNIVKTNKINVETVQNEIRTEENKIKPENEIGIEQKMTRIEPNSVNMENNLVKTNNLVRTDHNLIGTEPNLVRTEHNLVRTQYNGVGTEHNEIGTERNVVGNEHNYIRTETCNKTAQSEVKIEHNLIGTKHNLVRIEHNNHRPNNNLVRIDHNVVGTEDNMVESVHNLVGTVHNMIGTVHNTVGTVHNMVGTVHNMVGTVHNMVENEHTMARTGYNLVKTENNVSRTELNGAKTATEVRTIKSEVKTEHREVKFEPKSEVKTSTSTSNFQIPEKLKQNVVETQNLKKHELINGIKQENGKYLNNIDNNINFLQEQNEAFDLTVKRDNINTHSNIKTARLSQNGTSSINCTQSEQIAIPKRKTQEKNPFSIDSILNKDTVAKPVNSVANGSNYQTIMAYYEFANSLLQNQMLNYFTSGLYPFQTSLHYPGFHSIINPMPYFNYDFSGNTSINRQIKIEKIIEKKSEKPSVPSCEFCHKTFASFSCLYYSKTYPAFKKQLFRFSKIKNTNKELVCVCCDYTTEEDSDSDTSDKKKLKSDKIDETSENIDETNICEDDKDKPDKTDRTSEKTEPKKVQAGWFGKGYRKNRKPKKKQYSNSR